VRARAKKNDQADEYVGVRLTGIARRTARAEPSPHCASPMHAAFDPRPRAKRSVDPIGVATATAPRCAAIACVPTIDEDTGHDIDEFVDVTHVSPIGITCGEH
jgi:hypothetical protein